MVEPGKNCVLNAIGGDQVQVYSKCPKCGANNMWDLMSIPIMPPGNEWKKTDCQCPSCGERYEMSVLFR